MKVVGPGHRVKSGRTAFSCQFDADWPDQSGIAYLYRHVAEPISLPTLFDGYPQGPRDQQTSLSLDLVKLRGQSNILECHAQNDTEEADQGGGKQVTVLSCNRIPYLHPHLGVVYFVKMEDLPKRRVEKSVSISRASVYTVMIVKWSKDKQ